MIETIIHPPKQLALSLQEVKDTLRISSMSEDIRLVSIIQAATSWVENMARCALLTQTRKAIFYLNHDIHKSSRHERNRVYLPTHPLQEVKTVLFQSNPVDAYQIIDNRYILLPNFSQPGELIIVYLVGYGSKQDDIPPPLKQAILLAVVRFYEDMVFPQEREVSSLISPYRPISIH